MKVGGKCLLWITFTSYPILSITKTMKRILLFSLCLLAFSLQAVWGQKKALDETRKVIERVTGKSDLPVSFVLKANKGQVV